MIQILRKIRKLYKNKLEIIVVPYYIPHNQIIDQVRRVKRDR